MYNILLVDDDPFFKSVFVNNFDWESHGFTIAANADNGMQAIDLLQCTLVDLAFIDMCMPSMNGPDLIGYIHRHYPNIICFALSNYDDFDFVKESFRAGASDYVLKQCLNQSETQRMLDAFLEKRTALQPQQAISSKIVLPDEETTAQFLSAFIEGKFTQSQQDHILMDALQIPSLSKNLLLFRTEITHFDQFRQKYYLLSRLKYTLRSVCSIMRNIMEHHARGVVFFNDNDDGFYSILCDDRFEDRSVAEYTAHLYTQQISSALKMYFNVECLSAAAPLVSDIRDISAAYREIMTARNKDAELMPTIQIDDDAFYARALISLRSMLQTDDADSLPGYIEPFYHEGRRLCYARETFLHISVILYRAYLACCNNVPENASRVFSALLSCQDADEMQAIIIDVCTDFYNQKRSSLRQTYTDYVQKALDFIAHQYALPTLSLNMIADIIHVSDSYLSRCFKTEVGVGLSEYISRFRIDRAKVMLAVEQKSIKTVAQSVGFDNYTYFFRIFKKHTGMTPKEFCDSVGLPNL